MATNIDVDFCDYSDCNILSTNDVIASVKSSCMLEKINNYSCSISQKSIRISRDISECTVCTRMQDQSEQ